MEADPLEDELLVEVPLRGEAQRLRLNVAQTSENARRLERELAVARGTIEGLERQVRAA
jgi:hypothetical protein